MSHTVTPKIKKELSKFAERITPPDGAGSTPGKGLTGLELREQYGLTVDSHGKPLQPLQRYFLKDLPRVNHLRRLCKAYEAGAWPQVELYLQRYRTPERIAKDAEAAAAAQVQPVATVREFHGKEYEAALPPSVFINGNKVEGITNLTYSPAVFEPLPEVAADAVATELQVSRPVQEVMMSGRGAGRTYARRSLLAGMVHTGTITLTPEDAAALRELTAEVLAYPPDASAQHWFDEAGPLQHVPTAAQRLAAAYEAGVAVPPLKLWRDYRREICGAEWYQGCTQPCGEHCPMLGHRCTPQSFAENQAAADAEAAA